ncbi:MAG TPA: ABC transporter permease [Chitinophagaceae bacterium]
MIRRSIEIIGSSFKMALQELWKNKLRTFLSLFGITIGIFCIIGVLATVNSLEQNIRNELNSLGNNTIYIDKWNWGQSGMDSWKYANRPSPKFSEVKQVKERTPSAKYVGFKISRNDRIEYNDNILSGVNLYGVNDEFQDIQNIDIAVGRNISDGEYESGSSTFVIGNEIAAKLFGGGEIAIGKQVVIRGKKGLITGVFKKQGKTMVGGWNFDESVVMPYKFARTFMDERYSQPLLMVQGIDGLSSKELKDDLTGTMRAIHKLAPTKEDDFSLNDINDFTEEVSSVFKNVNIGGWAIAALSLIVGMFGVANIMFVSVRERTNQIGLKKAVGAKKRVILAEFLLESAFLCIIGGLIGLLLVFGLTQVLTNALNFPVFVSPANMALAIFICILTGILAGFIPASQAARMDPVVAIRSK